jgi:hypothetical protein
MLLIDDPSLYQNGILHLVYDRVRSEQPIYFNAGQHPLYAVMRHVDAVVVLQDSARRQDFRYSAQARLGRRSAVLP